MGIVTLIKTTTKRYEISLTRQNLVHFKIYLLYDGKISEIHKLYEGITFDEAMKKFHRVVNRIIAENWK